MAGDDDKNQVAHIACSGRKLHMLKFLCVVIGVILCLPAIADDGRISVSWARYRPVQPISGHECSAGDVVKSICNGAAGCTFYIDNSLCGDPAPGYWKELGVDWRCGDIAKSLIVGKEETTIQLDCAPVNRGGQLKIIRAVFEGQQRVKFGDVFFFIADACDDESSCSIDSRLLPIRDPDPDFVKYLIVHYQCGNEVSISKVPQSQKLELKCP